MQINETEVNKILFFFYMVSSFFGNIESAQVDNNFVCSRSSDEQPSWHAYPLIIMYKIFKILNHLKCENAFYNGLIKLGQNRSSLLSFLNEG